MIIITQTKRKRLLCALFSVALLLVGPVHIFAQKGTPARNKAILKLTLDEQGKIISHPSSFSLVEGNTYDFEVTVKAPLLQQEKLKKSIIDKLNSTYKKLSDDNDPVNKIYKQFFTKVDKSSIYQSNDYKDFVAEYKSLADILSQKDQAKAEQDLQIKSNSVTDFKYLPSAKVFAELLFGNIFYLSVNGKDTIIKCDKNGFVKIKDLKANIEDLSLVIQTANLQKQFLTGYYNATFPAIAAWLSSIKPADFYNNIINGQIETFTSFREYALKRLDPKSDKLEGLFCEPEYNFKLQYLRSNYNNNDLIRLLQNNPEWFLKWAWYTEGEIKLNPFNFTNESRLVLKGKFDRDKAERMDKYVDNGIQRMLDPKTDIKISMPAFDSLNRKKDAGKDIYSFKADNEALIGKNKVAANAFQQIKETIDSVSFRVVTKDDKPLSFLKIYDGGSYILSSPDTRDKALPLDKKVEILGYNIRSTEIFSVTPVFKDAKDESKAIAQLNEIGDLSGLIGTQSAAALPLYSLLDKTFGQPQQLDLVMKNLSAEVPGLTVPKKGEALVDEEESRFYKLVKSKPGKPLSLKFIYGTDDIPNKEIDVLKKIKDMLTPQKLNCDTVLRLILNNIEEVNYEKVHTWNAFLPIIKEELSVIRNKIKVVSEKTLLEMQKETYNQLRNDYPYLTIAKIIYDNEGYQLPPDNDFKVKENPTAPSYSNWYVSVPEQQSTKNVTLPLQITNRADGKVLKKRTESYTISSPHWVTASMGLGYVFKDFRKSDVTITDGKIVNTPDENKVRLMAGFHFYIKPIVLTDSRFVLALPPEEMLSRLSLFGGFSFPKPLENPHWGISVEPWPGVKVLYGWHYYKQTNYTIINDQVADQKSGYRYNSPFLGLTIDPVTFVKLLGFIK